ncbi:hypothetical protein ABID21_001883 [Pseudorhizobium tarimense]|uniref:Haemolysin XhlA n=1 Tax=Pseudorhizobium tarimense TaxID=1079109 RepID=A0ABV2H5T2_9HYPH|nr:hemolysin XhlA family protein [Pseudorhizobium tarimense]MCJ8518979.1 hemolysin XhlA family protein [Pseudorhizobium tarimense]
MPVPESANQNEIGRKAMGWMESFGRSELKSGGNGGNDGGMEARVAKLEAAVEFIQRDVAELKTDIKDMRGDITSIRTTDFRILFGAIISVALGLAGLMAKGFGWL